MNLAKAVANAAAMMVLKAKNVAQVADDAVLQNRVIAAATQCALSTSQLVACAKVQTSVRLTDFILTFESHCAKLSYQYLCDMHSFCKKLVDVHAYFCWWCDVSQLCSGVTWEPVVHA